MNVRQLRAVLAKLPDDAIVVTKFTSLGNHVNFDKVMYSSKMNLVLVKLDEEELDKLAMQLAVDRVDAFAGGDYAEDDC